MRCCVSTAIGVAFRVLRSSRLLPVTGLIGAGLLASACASSYASYDRPSNVGAQVGTQVAVAVPPVVEIEADGLAVQAPPRIRKHAEPDDPREPFSPNYGPAPDMAPDASEPASTPVVPRREARQPALQYRSRTTRMSPDEVQAIIVQAMIAHERRNP